MEIQEYGVYVASPSSSWQILRNEAMIGVIY